MIEKILAQLVEEDPSTIAEATESAYTDAAKKFGLDRAVLMDAAMYAQQRIGKHVARLLLEKRGDDLPPAIKLAITNRLKDEE